MMPRPRPPRLGAIVPTGRPAEREGQEPRGIGSDGTGAGAGVAAFFDTVAGSYRGGERSPLLIAPSPVEAGDPAFDFRQGEMMGEIEDLRDKLAASEAARRKAERERDDSLLFNHQFAFGIAHHAECPEVGICVRCQRDAAESRAARAEAALREIADNGRAKDEGLCPWCDEWYVKDGPHTIGCAATIARAALAGQEVGR